MKKERKNITKWMYYFSLAIAIILVAKVVHNFPPIGNWISNFFKVITPFIVGIIIAYILYIPSRGVEKILKKVKFVRKIARPASVFIVYAIFISIIALTMKFVIPSIISSIRELFSNMHTYFDTIKNWYMGIPEGSILKNENLMNAISSFKVEDYINTTNIGQYAKGLISFVNSILNIFISVMVSIYLLLERHQIVEFGKKFVKATTKEKTYKKVAKYFHKTNEIFCKFIASQFMDAVVVGALASIAMSIMKIKYGVLLGVFIGLFNMIPYFGAIIAVGTSIIITILTGGFGKAIEMAIVVIILQQLDANIINPKIVGNSLKMSPLLVIFSVTIGGAYFGILGMFLAVPVAAITKVIICDYIEYKSQKNV